MLFHEDTGFRLSPPTSAHPRSCSMSPQSPPPAPTPQYSPGPGTSLATQAPRAARPRRLPSRQNPGGEPGWSRCTLHCAAPPPPLTHLAVEASVALRAGTLVGAIAVMAGATVQAGPRVTLVDVMLAVAAREARWTQAGKGIDAIHAGAAIEAGAGGVGSAGGERGGNPSQQLPPCQHLPWDQCECWVPGGPQHRSRELRPHTASDHVL